jgi:hypothetical protein
MAKKRQIRKRKHPVQQQKKEFFFSHVIPVENK